ncbi:hypothetical protein KSD_66540 [Ktedonobacter sp. SOSP1-85]|uniref:hypothetical protein n=1 Tax=Ktedonobacter sp. SOSP1-85 TaxID=2778367 RepID=UPI0019166F43|nr:hypothetical protein [Ktedonobacter sp. SOSP1-85]GHO78883.1 hypothetical protein KSD_66540 [Ktedonobacter sp. SOSP1-85]
MVNNHPGAAGKGLNKPTPTPGSGANLVKPNAQQGQPQPGANLAKPNAQQGPGAPPSPPPPQGPGAPPASPPPPSGRPTINITNQVINQVNINQVNINQVNVQVNNHYSVTNNITINNPAAEAGGAGKRDWGNIIKTMVDESVKLANSGLNLMEKTYGAGMRVVETAAK